LRIYRSAVYDTVMYTVPVGSRDPAGVVPVDSVIIYSGSFCHRTCFGRFRASAAWGYARDSTKQARSAFQTV